MKPLIQKIKFTKEEQNEIDLINKGERVPTIKTITDKKTGVKRDIVYNKRFTEESAIKRLRKLHGGLCCVCGDYPDYKVLYDVGDGAKRLEQYCQKDYDKWKDRL